MQLTIERVIAFNGLDVLVARDEGSSRPRGWTCGSRCRRRRRCARRRTARCPKPVTNQGLLVDRGEAGMFQG